MLGLTEKIRISTSLDCFTDTELATLLGVSVNDNQRHALVKRATAKGEFIKIRRGLYCFAEKYRKNKLNTFALAQRLYPPSYISLESALHFHSLIPEAVYSVTSVSLRRSVSFDTPVGRFDFSKIPEQVFHLGVQRVANEIESFFIATPEKSILDYLYVYKLDWRGIADLQNSLRIEEEEISKLSIESFQSLEAIYVSKRIRKFIRHLTKEIT